MADKKLSGAAMPPRLVNEKPPLAGCQFYAINQDVCDIVFNELGNSSAQLRVMIVLIGTKTGFAVTEKWLMDRTGLNSSSYYRAKSALIERGWLTYEPNQKIIINYNNILKG